ncbi:ABC transporter permease [Salinibius halmophilus]|uniref:ABC transporter permease n=1 Tax=Salinibius halmophilus TaxID=1853216 RepID=UPI000E6724AD|nr:FtsX-like permease family protein [Salinibius halmophilus]
MIWRMLWRQRKAAELWILISALFLAVTTVTAIGLFAERIQATILSEAGTLIASDRLVASDGPLPDWLMEATEPFERAEIISFQATVFAQGRIQLTAMKAVSDSYPLKGTLEVSDRPFGNAEVVLSGPAPGKIWLASRVMAALEVTPGDMVQVGRTELEVEKALLKEPDSAGAAFGVNPRAMMNIADVPSTQAVQPGSRVDYDLLLAGNTAELDKLEPLVEEAEGLRWRDPADSSAEVGDALGRATSFLLLAGSLAVMLAGSALAVASNRFGSRQASTVALLKTLGMSPKAVVNLYVLQFVLLATLVTAIGVGVGIALHGVLIELLRGYFPQDIEFAGMRAIWLGIATGALSLLGFALPPIWSLRNVAPMQVLREQGLGRSSRRWHLVWGVGVMLLLIWLYSSDWLIAAIVLLGVAIIALGALVLGYGLMAIARRLASGASQTIRLGVATLYRHRHINAAQLMVFSVAIMLLFVMTLVRTDLLNTWQEQLPEDAPNQFVYNLFEEDLPVFEQWQQNNGIEPQPMYPITRGRVVAVGSEDIAARLGSDAFEGEYRREINFTWAPEPGTDNEIVAGEWWQPDDDRLLVSIEQEWAEGIGLSVGEQITVRIGGLEETAIVSSLRTVEWDSLNPNFYFIYNKPLLDGAGATWLTSFYLPNGNQTALAELVGQIPTLSLIEVDAIIQQVQDIVSRVTRAVEFVLALVLIAGLIVLTASVVATIDLRLREGALLRALGAPQKLVKGMLLTEFVALGALAGLLAAMGAEATVAVLQTQVFQLSLSWHPWLWLVGPILGGLIIGFVGSWSTRNVVKVPPLWVLRNQ